jgi:hypothetical protein
MSKSYNGLCCSINGDHIIKLIFNEITKISYIKISSDGGLFFNDELLVAENFKSFTISCSPDAKITMVGGQNTITNKPSIYISVNYGYSFKKMIIDDDNLNNQMIIDTSISEMTYGQNTYLCLTAITNNQRIFYSSIKNIDCQNNDIEVEDLVLFKIENLLSFRGLLMKNSKIAIVNDIDNYSFTIYVSTFFNEGSSAKSYIVNVNSFKIFVDSSINTFMQYSFSEFFPLALTYDVRTIFNENYNTGFCFINKLPMLSFNVYRQTGNDLEAGYLYSFNGSEWINSFYDPSQLITQTSLTGMGISALATSNNGLFVAALVNDVESTTVNKIYISNNGFLSYNITTCNTFDYCKNICMTTSFDKLIKIFLLSPNSDFFICSTNDETINKMSSSSPSLVNINFTPREIFGFSKNLKKNPNIFMVKLLMNIHKENKLEFDEFIKKCFTLENKKNMIEIYNLFKLYYSNTPKLYYKTMLNIINCIQFNTLNRKIPIKIKKYLKCLFYNIKKFIKKITLIYSDSLDIKKAENSALEK